MLGRWRVVGNELQNEGHLNAEYFMTRNETEADATTTNSQLDTTNNGREPSLNCGQF